jgi:prepilin-type N-terminal cleavage/methylation domain-containing protein
MNRKAFTLIELLVVVAIIGILAAVGVVAYTGYTGAAKVAQIKQSHKQISSYIASEMMKCEIGLEVEAVTNNESYAYKNTMLSCARISQFYAKGVFDNITNYIQQTKNWKNAYGIEGCPLSNNCVNKSDAYQNFGGVPPVKWNGNMHCWWPGNGRDNQSGQCASRYGTGTNDYVQTSFPKVGG